MPSTWSAYLKDDESMDDSELGTALKYLPPAMLTFLQTDIAPMIATQKIQAIKAVREKTHIGLRGAKRIVDLMQSGTILDSCRIIQPGLLDAIEATESCLRTAIRESTYDDEAMSALLGIRQQMTDLWLSLVELPLPPKED